MSNFEGAMDNARQFTETLCQIIESLEAEIAELRAGQGRWPEKADDFPCCTSTTPRVITADELREGQLICIHRGHSWGLRAIGTFVGLEGDLVTIKAGGGRTFTESTKFHTIALLEDAPEPEQRGESIGIRDVRKGDVLDGYYWDITPGGVTLKDAVCTREVEGRTSFIEVEQSGETHQIGFSSSDVELRLVHRPDRSPVTAETIQQSEPGSTWEDDAGEVLEWTGRQLRWQVTADWLGEGDYINVVEDGELVRSTAAPIGDYSAPPRLTIHKLNVAPEGSLAVKPKGSIFAPMRKVHSGKWVTVGDGLMDTRVQWSAEDLIEYGWADGTLHYPERGDDE